MLTLREEFLVVVLGTVFLSIGIASCSIAAVRGGSSRRTLGWFGLFSAMYGVRLFAAVPAAFSLLAGRFSAAAPNVVWVITYVILIPALLFWAELTVGALRRFFHLTMFPVSAVAIAAIVAVVVHRSPTRFMPYNSFFVLCLLLTLAVANLVPQISRKYLVVQSPVSTIGTLILAAAVIHDNAATFVPMQYHPFFEPVAFALFVFSQGWVAAEKVLSDERRLLSIENELAIAREIQSSILPEGVPQLRRLRVSAAYYPMTAVAGDFYWFLASDPHRAGFLVADVSGHGVPAALIASMIKVAMQSVVSCADNPREVLRRLGQVLSGQLRGQFVSAAYLWLDTENHRALYSAAGHPPLLHWTNSRLERVESNGLIFGVMPDCDYPVREIRISPGDRFMLYTDGLSEPENHRGEAFGDHRLAEVAAENQSRPASEMSDRLLSALRKWQPASQAQQDDITLLIIDAL